jgi:predicted flap endonuclease-1-like 5' DNA nuclease
MIWLQENWIIAAIVAVLAILIIGFLIRRPKAESFDFGEEEQQSSKQTKAAPPKPLEPKKPEIIAAEPAKFKPLEPAPAPKPAPVVAPAPPPAPTPVAAPAPIPAAKPEATEAATSTVPAAPAPTPAPATPSEVPPPAAPAAGDNLRLIKGLGPKLATLLNSLGIYRFEQIAAWSDSDIATIDAQLGTFQGRITRDNWVDQASYLARRDKAGFEAKYGALGGEL